MAQLSKDAFGRGGRVGRKRIRPQVIRHGIGHTISVQA